MVRFLAAVAALLALAIVAWAVCISVRPRDEKARSGHDNAACAQQDDADAGAPPAESGSHAGEASTPKCAPCQYVYWWSEQLSPDWISALFAVVVALATLAYVAVAHWQLGQISRQADISEKASVG